MGVGARIRFLVLYPLQGCTIRRLVSLARPRRLAEPDKAQNSIRGAFGSSDVRRQRHWREAKTMRELTRPRSCLAPAAGFMAGFLQAGRFRFAESSSVRLLCLVEGLAQA